MTEVEVNPTDFGSKLQSPGYKFVLLHGAALLASRDAPTSPISLSRADDLAHTLQIEIMTGEIPMGTRLRQEDLAARFGVSRTPIREALRQLQAIGLVEQLGHRGALVRAFTAAECRNVFLVRAELEGLAAERAAGRLTNYDNADLATAQSLLRAGLRAHSTLERRQTSGRAIIREQWSHANELFHNVILAAANCAPLRETVQSLANQGAPVAGMAHVSATIPASSCARSKTTTASSSSERSGAPPGAQAPAGPRGRHRRHVGALARTPLPLIYLVNNGAWHRYSCDGRSRAARASLRRAAAIGPIYDMFSNWTTVPV